jgi:hypothetical protein
MLALPFLMISALLLIGCFLIVRLAVMLFPAFAVMGALPASRGLVIGLGRVVAAAAINAVIFAIGSGVTIAVLGILFHPGGGAPGWLSLVLMPVFSFIMWVALKPFRRLTAMVDPNGNHFGSGAGAFGHAANSGKRMIGRAVAAGIAGATGGAAAGAVVAASIDDDEDTHRVEADPVPSAPTVSPSPLALSAAVAPRSAPEPPGTPPRDVASDAPSRAAREPRHASEPPPSTTYSPPFTPYAGDDPEPPPPTDPEWYDGEQVYPIYRPATAREESADDEAREAS